MDLERCFQEKCIVLQISRLGRNGVITWVRRKKIKYYVNYGELVSFIEVKNKNVNIVSSEGEMAAGTILSYEYVLNSRQCVEER